MESALFPPCKTEVSGAGGGVLKHPLPLPSTILLSFILPHNSRLVRSININCKSRLMVYKPMAPLISPRAYKGDDGVILEGDSHPYGQRRHDEGIVYEPNFYRSLGKEEGAFCGKFEREVRCLRVFLGEITQKWFKREGGGGGGLQWNHASTNSQQTRNSATENKRFGFMQILYVFRHSRQGFGED